MATIRNEMLAEAAKVHSVAVLGTEQFENNPNAVESITNDFMVGCKYFLSLLTDNGDLINLVD